MKKYLYTTQKGFFTTLFCLLLIACSSEQKPPETPRTDSLSVVQDTVKVSLNLEILKDNYPLLYKITQGKSVQKELKDYVAKVAMPDYFKTEEDFYNLFTKRDSIVIPQLNTVLEDWAYKNMDDYESLQAVGEELDKNGILLITAEGMYAGLGSAPVLTDKLKEVGSEVFQWFIQFNNALGASLGSEYTFMDLEPESEMIRIGEAMRNKYPTHPYTRKIEPEFREALTVFTDIHLVEDKEADYSSPLVYGMSRDFYPSAAEFDAHKNFVKKYKNSRYYSVVKNILENPSAIGTSEEETVYMVVTDRLDSKKTAQKKVYEYLDAGKDIPHFFALKRNDGTNQYAVVYRFFNDEDVAHEAEHQATEMGFTPEFIAVKSMGWTDWWAVEEL